MQEPEIVHVPGWGRRLICPECDNHLPVNQMGECDECGMHFRLRMEVTAPAIGEDDDTN